MSVGWRVALYVTLLFAPATSAGAEARVLTLDEAMKLARERNPDLLARSTDVDAARARLEGAELLLQSNPTLAVEAGPRDMGSTDRSVEYSFQVLQQIEVAGQRGLRMDAAGDALDETDARLRALRVAVAAQVRENFGRVLAAEQRVDLASESFAIAQQGVGAVDERFRAGAVPLIELNTARGELGRATRERAEAQRQLSEALADLRLSIGLDASEELTARGELSTDVVLEDTDDLVAAALESRSELEAARRALASARTEERLAERSWVPSPRVGATYRYEGDTDTTIVLGVVQVDLPIFNRNTAARGVATARVRELEVLLEATERRIEQEVLVATDRVRAAAAAAKGYAGDVVEAMQQNMQLVTESYRSGKIDFLQLVLIRRQAVDAQREYIDVLEELNAAEAQLQRAIGRADG